MTRTRPFAPFHWEVEFPEVFDRENPGFDAFVGNPPFAGKNAVAAGNVCGYPDWLKTRHDESHGNADLVAHFFRRAFDLVRAGGTFGLIATNTIAQGDTRSTGLRWICEHGGEIYRGRQAVPVARRGRGRGERAAMSPRRGMRETNAPAAGMSRLPKSRDGHATGRFPGSRVLDGAKVDAITAFLFHRGGHADPVRLQANAGKSFQGSIVLGMGFTFDDTDKKGVASPLAEMQRLIEADPRNREVIFPYIGGEEVNTSPTHTHHRYVINFRDWPLRRTDRQGRQAQASKTWTPGSSVPGSADILSVRAGGQPWTTRRRPGIVPADTMPAPANALEQSPLIGRATGVESRPTSPETGREAMRTPADRDRDGEAGDERGSGDDVPVEMVEMASWAGATDAERREWLRSGVVPMDYPGPVAMDWPELVAIVEERVKPDRMKNNRAGYRQYWWQYGEKRVDLYAAIADLERVLAVPQTSNVQALVFLSPQMVFGHTLIVFPLDTNSAFAVLQSRIHQIWSAFLGPTMKDDLRYTPSDCFDTFSFPDGWETHPSLEATGKAVLRAPRRPHGPQQRRHDQDLQPLPRPLRGRPRHRPAPRAARRHGPRRSRRLRLDRHPHRLRLPPRLRDRRSHLGPEEEAVPPPLAGRHPRRGARPPPRPQTPNAPPRRPVPAHRRPMPYKTNRPPQDRQQRGMARPSRPSSRSRGRCAMAVEPAAPMGI